MLVESHILPPSPEYPLYIAAKRYWLPEFEKNTSNPSGQTLIVLHSTSFQKETWEPALADLFDLVSTSKPGHGSNVPIREAWMIDCPNHGESGALNHRVLKTPQFANFSCEKYAQAVHRFLSAGPNRLQGVRVDFRKRNLVGIGHSLGGNAMLMLQHIQPAFKFSTLIIIEPLVSPEGSHYLKDLRERLVARARKRREFWPNREVVEKEFTKPNRTPLTWEPRVLRTFIKYGFYSIPEKNYIALCCSPQQEVIMYLDEEGSTKPVEALNKICHSVPVHLILGSKKDFIPSEIHQVLLDPNSGRRFASLRVVDGVGHLIPQEQPTRLASHLSDILSSAASTLSPPAPSRL